MRMEVKVKSGYYDVINGKDSTWHNVTPTLKSKSSYITNAVSYTHLWTLQ